MSNAYDESADQIGCIDGSVLRVTMCGTEVHLKFGDKIAPLSHMAVERLTTLLQSKSRDSPVSVAAPKGPSRRMGAAVNPGVAELLGTGLVDDGTVLTLRHRGIEHTATVSANGQIAFDGRLYDSPSGAAQAACEGASVNGWTAWKLFDGSAIDEKRWLFRAGDFPGQGHSYADSSAKEMRQIALRWVEHALDARLDPAEPGDEVEVFLGGHGYAESTLESYRRHLRNWRDLYGGGAAER